MAKKQFLKLRRLAEDQDITTDELAAKAGIVFAASIVTLRNPAKRKRPQLIWRRSFRSFGFVVFS